MVSSLRNSGRESELHRFFLRIAQSEGEFLIDDDGFRGRTFRSSEIARLAAAFARRLRSQGIHKGDAVVIWSESRAGWMIALWGCFLEGAVAVPVEPQSSIDLFRKIKQKVRARLVLVGNRVTGSPEGDVPVGRIDELEQCDENGKLERNAVFEEDVAEIVFTSGTTGEPKRVVITHANLAAQLR